MQIENKTTLKQDQEVHANHKQNNTKTMHSKEKEKKNLKKKGENIINNATKKHIHSRK